MRSDKVIFRNFITTTEGSRDLDGYWKVVLTCTETDSVDGELWEKESIAFMGMDRIYDEAHKVALRAYYSWMQEFAWGRGTGSLIDSVRKLKNEDVPKQESVDGDSNKGDEVTAA